MPVPFVKLEAKGAKKNYLEQFGHADKRNALLQTARVASYTARLAPGLALAITTSFVQVILA